MTQANHFFFVYAYHCKFSGLKTINQEPITWQMTTRNSVFPKRNLYNVATRFDL